MPVTTRPAPAAGDQGWSGLTGSIDGADGAASSLELCEAAGLLSGYPKDARPERTAAIAFVQGLASRVQASMMASARARPPWNIANCCAGVAVTTQ